MSLAACRAALLAAVAAALPCPSAGAAAEHALGEDVVAKFKAFAEAHSKEYTDETIAERMDIFARNLAFIEEFNRQATDGGVRLGVNQFADLTADEFRRSYLSGLAGRPRGGDGTVVDEAFAEAAEPPASMDWVAKGAVTPVKDQKLCGSCWAFSTTGAIEGAVFVAQGSLVSLSEEELVDCSRGANRGCNGGEPRAALKWVVENGICSEKSYPYAAFQDECHNQFTPCTPVAHISTYKAVPQMNELALKAAVARQPISVEIEADTEMFRFYKSGVLQGSGCGFAMDHAVLAVGYGTQTGQDYWLVKNSWNVSWGDEGYVKIARTDSTSSAGECGIAIHPTFPVIGNEASSLVV